MKKTLLLAAIMAAASTALADTITATTKEEGTEAGLQSSFSIAGYTFNFGSSATITLGETAISDFSGYASLELTQMTLTAKPTALNLGADQTLRVAVYEAGTGQTLGDYVGVSDSVSGVSKEGTAITFSSAAVTLDLAKSYTFIFVRETATDEFLASATQIDDYITDKSGKNAERLSLNHRFNMPATYGNLEWRTEDQWYANASPVVTYSISAVPYRLTLPAGEGSMEEADSYSLISSNLTVDTTATIDNVKKAGTVTLTGAITTGAYKLIAEGMGTLVLGGGTGVGSLEVKEGTTARLMGTGSLAAADGTVELATGAYLELSAAADMDLKSAVTGMGTVVKLGSGTVSAANTIVAATLDIRLGCFELSGNSPQLSGAGVALDSEGELLLGTAAGNAVSSLSGSGTVSGGALSVNGTKAATFSGSLAGTQLTVKGTQQVFGTLGGTGTITVESGAVTSFDLTQGDQDLTLNTLALGSGSHTTFTFAQADAAPLGLANDIVPVNGIDIDELDVDDKAVLTISMGGHAIKGDADILLGTIDSAPEVEGGYTLSLLGSAFDETDDSQAQLIYRADSRELVLHLVGFANGAFTRVATNSVSLAGASLLRSVDTDTLPAGSDLADTWHGIHDDIVSGDEAAADAALAAVAGASTATLGHAFAGDMERQLRAIRNRTTTMGVNADVWNEDLPYFNAWINAEGDYRKVDADGYLPGYELSSWGGTVGFDVDMADCLTAGLAFSALYGDLETDGADKAKGDMDTYYLSAFARATSGRWVHTFVGSVGRMSATLDRTVNCGTGSYRTQGETEGLGFGLMYEVGYTIPLDEDASVCLQPVANVTWRHISVDAYDEEGSDAGLAVGEQSYNTVTFGLGARMQAVVGESMFNRASILELRALMKLDAGDREGEAEVALLHGDGTKAKVNTAELGAVGAEVGLGLTVPISPESSSLFVDLSAEFRGGSTNANAAAGYRVNF